MKNLLFLLYIFCFFFGNAVAVEKEPLRAEDSIVVEAGKVVGTGILSDVDGTIFLEFLRDLRVVTASGKYGSQGGLLPSFEGEILPPEIIEPLLEPPRARMREILTFELLTDSGEDVAFLERFTVMKTKHRIKELIENPNQAVYRAGATLLTKIDEVDEIGKPALWEFQNDENEWRRLGGKLEDSEEDNIQIFSSLISRSGIYAVFDENPLPSFEPAFPVDQIEMVEMSPFPSVEVSPENADLSDMEDLGELEASPALPLGVEGESTLVVPGIAVPELSGLPIRGGVEVSPVLEESEELVLDSEGRDSLGLERVGAVPTEGRVSVISPEVGGAEREREIAEIAAEVPEGSTLPTTGKKEPYKFPWGIILAIGVLVGCGYLAIKKA